MINPRLFAAAADTATSTCSIMDRLDLPIGGKLLTSVLGPSADDEANPGAQRTGLPGRNGIYP